MSQITLPKNNKRTISVVGPTCSGKTARAMEIATQLLNEKNSNGVDIISADSRQVYKGLEILTGADVPEGFKGSVTLIPPKSDLPYFTNVDDSIRIHGISMIEPTEEWSLAHFVNYSREVIQKSWSNGRQPILVGGTGLYHKHLFSDDSTPQIPQDLIFRKKAEKLSVENLQQWLAEIDSMRLDQMNESDKENPRRIIRAIEVATWQKKHGDSPHGESKSSESPIIWSQVENQVEFLTAPLEIIKERIEQRVQRRFISGAVEEVQDLLELNLPDSSPVLTTLGVPEIRQYLDGSLPADDCKKLWSLHEFQYAKRQLTWWKKI